jgi:hypothetical protein
VHGHEKQSRLHNGGGGPWWRGGFLICENIRGKAVNGLYGRSGEANQVGGLGRRWSGSDAWA